MVIAVKMVKISYNILLLRTKNFVRASNDGNSGHLMKKGSFLTLNAKY